MTIELYLFRHGRTVWNAEGRYQGIADVDLDELGKLQAKAVARRCREIGPAALYSSDLRRCADVAAEISEATGLEVVKDKRLRERDVGTWSGLTHPEVLEKFPEDYCRWTKGDEDVRPGGGETVNDVIVRIEDFCAALRATEVSGIVIAVTHAAWIRSTTQWMFGNTFPRKCVGVPTQGSLTVVHLQDDGSARLEAYNDRGHLLEVEDIDRKGPAPTIY